MGNPTAAMLVIGDEVLSGRTKDANTNHLALRLTEKGVALKEARVVADAHDDIVAAVRALSERWDHVFTSGGIGPTHDDITADAVAAAFGAPIGVRDDARAILEAYYEPGELNDARLRMARIPEGASLIDNPVSQAPGFTLRNVNVMAGVPKIFQAMVESVLPGIAGGEPVLSHSLRAYVPEGTLAEPLGRIAATWDDVSFGCYPFNRAGVGATVVARHVDRARLAEAADAVRAMLAELGAGEIAETPPA